MSPTQTKLSAVPQAALSHRVDQRLRQAWRAKWLSRHTPSDEVTLTRRHVYILPTRAGLMLAITLIVLLLASINYQLNLGYLLTFLLAGCAAAGIVVCHETLRGLQLHLQAPSPVFAGQSAVIEVDLINPKRRASLGIGLTWVNTKLWAYCDVPATGQSSLHLLTEPLRRGLHEIPAIKAETRFPLGTFRVWTIWRPQSRILVYPQPETHPPALPLGDPVAGQGGAHHTPSVDEFDGVRAWRRGDPMKHVVWKKFAKTGDLISRDSAQAQRHEIWLDFQQTGLSNLEARLSRMTAWVLAADAQNVVWGLRLPNAQISPDSGPLHRQRCLEALALC